MCSMNRPLVYKIHLRRAKRSLKGITSHNFRFKEGPRWTEDDPEEEEILFLCSEVWPRSFLWHLDKCEKAGVVLILFYHIAW